ncbi:MAG: hypothetical protein ACYTAS_10530 [Planctomycetota bacterium]|jgi:hypothetical protein
MPCYLKEVDVVGEVRQFRSVLIVPCRLCPAVSSAVRQNRPFIELCRGNLKTRCYEDLIRNMRLRLEEEGVRTDVFRSSFLSYVQCMWTARKRERLQKRASGYEAVIVVGCDTAYESVCEMLAPTDCQVFNGMETEGLLNVIPQFEWPLKISLKLSHVTATRGSTSECSSTRLLANSL